MNINITGTHKEVIPNETMRVIESKGDQEIKTENDMNGNVKLKGLKFMMMFLIVYYITIAVKNWNDQ
ncbi:hypothetical protein RhiirA1_463952 [Rhizophagus irregularis]|uniref:Uncharacterized protein n=1 Tax=Rhizophagus irregularis TaxID=588596 RepID=A0A2I1EHS4_9GLOM|nr:hypothetical protein RhiirA1_463952 [Rhizophagus irregularis]PKY21664.1 hypothetical protein RhiirB3_435326 [Rhizophagus irregularis]